MAWDFVRTPKWIVRHVLVVVLVVVMVNLGFWQLRRLDEKQAYEDLVDARAAATARPVEEVLAAGVDVDDVLYRRVEAAGRYLHEDTVVVENRTYNSASGGWVLTPLDLGGGTAVLVNRGFIGFDAEGRIVAPEPPAGEVEVAGYLFPSQERGSFGARDPEAGKLSVVARVDLDRIDAQVAADLLPAYVQAAASRPAEPTAAAGAAQIVPLGAPDPTEGPHLSYAVQWFIFSTIAAGGYVLLLRKVAQDEAKAGVRVDA